MPLSSHTDHLNTPRLIADSTGTTVWRNDNTEPFGANPPDENPSGLGAFEFPLRFPGQYADKESNLSYNYFRDCYDPATGRYCESDPIGLGGGLNTYAYVRSNPLRYTDPFGLAKNDGFGGEGGSGGGFGPGLFDVFTRGTPTNDAFVRSIFQIGRALKEMCTPGESADDKQKRCTKEWERAAEICTELLTQPPQKRNRRATGGHTDMLGCMKGYVSQDCGGNKVTE